MDHPDGNPTHNSKRLKVEDINAHDSTSSAINATTTMDESRQENVTDQLTSTTQWSDVNFLHSEIFRYIPTLRRVHHRRVCSAWNHMLTDPTAAMTGVLPLGIKDLKNWKDFCQAPPDPQPEVFNQANYLPRLITPHTKTIVIDGQRGTVQPLVFNELFRSFLKLEPLKDIVKHHPQVTHFILHDMTYVYDNLLNIEDTKLYLSVRRNYLRALGFGPELGIGRAVTFSKLQLNFRDDSILGKQMEALRGVMVCLPCTKLTVESPSALSYNSPVYASLAEAYRKAIWPYPPDQIKWVEDYLTQLASIKAVRYRYQYLITEVKLKDLTMEPWVRPIRNLIAEGVIYCFRNVVICRLLGCIVSVEVLLSFTAVLMSRVSKDPAVRINSPPHPFK